MIAYLKSIIDEGTAASSKRFSLVVGVLALAGSTIGLTVAACLGNDVAASLAAVAVPLAGLAGHAYVGGKKAEAANAQQSGD